MGLFDQKEAVLMGDTKYEDMPLWKLLPIGILAIIALPILMVLMGIGYVYTFLTGGKL